MILFLLPTNLICLSLIYMHRSLETGQNYAFLFLELDLISIACCSEQTHFYIQSNILVHSHSTTCLTLCFVKLPDFFLTSGALTEASSPEPSVLNQTNLPLFMCSEFFILVSYLTNVCVPVNKYM